MRRRKRKIYHFKEVYHIRLNNFKFDEPVILKFMDKEIADKIEREYFYVSPEEEAKVKPTVDRIIARINKKYHLNIK